MSFGLTLRKKRGFFKFGKPFLFEETDLFIYHILYDQSLSGTAGMNKRFL